MTSSSRMQTRALAVTALCTALIAVCAQIAIPLPTQVPMTLHTFAVALCGYLLAPKLAGLAMIVYLLLGAVGVPVFSGFRGGMQVLTGPTGGFLIGFLLMIICCALSKKRIPALVLGIAGLLLCHLAGVVQYMLLMHISFPIAAVKVSLPFIIKDIASVVIAMALADRPRPLLHLDHLS